MSAGKATSRRCERIAELEVGDLYFWPTGNGKKIIILLEELGLPCTIKPINIGRGDQLTPDFLKISPNGRMPAIVDHEPMGGGAMISRSSMTGAWRTPSAAHQRLHDLLLFALAFGVFRRVRLGRPRHRSWDLATA
jgi:hypothetical protein